MAGASAVSVGTFNMVEPSFAGNLISGFDEYMTAEKFAHMDEIVGIAHEKGPVSACRCS